MTKGNSTKNPQSLAPPAVKVSLKLDWATHDAALYAVQNWHYSRCLPSGKSVRIGVWENGRFVGVVIFSMGATPNLLKSYSLTQQEGCELTRVALNDHQNEVSRILSIAVRLLRKHCPGLRLIVSFADSDQGHHGGIYQAGGWVFSGSAELDSWMIGGKKMHPRSVVAKFGSQSKQHILKFDPNARKTWGWKHRYLMPLDDEMRRQIEPLRKPYPKRAVSKVNVATPDQGVEGGVNPTTALQISEAPDA